MKKCPYCKSDLFEKAEYCLYCMKPLKEKTIIEPVYIRTKRLFTVIIILLLVIFLAALLFLWPKKTDSKSAHNSSEPSEVTSTGSNNSDEGISAYSSDNTSSDTELSSTQNPSTQGSTSQNSSGETSSTDTVTSISSDASSNYSSSEDVSSSENSTPSVPEISSIFETKEVKGGVEITGITSSDNSIVIPENLGGKKVVGIADSAFENSSIVSVFLPDTIEYIDDRAFINCNYLNEIIIPSSCRRIGLNAFTECDILSKIYIKSTSIQIDNYAFSTSYQRNVSLTIFAPPTVMTAINAGLFWDAEYVEWIG